MPHLRALQKFGAGTWIVRAENWLILRFKLNRFLSVKPSLAILSSLYPHPSGEREGAAPEAPASMMSWGNVLRPPRFFAFAVKG